MLLGIENQTEVHYAMPVRNMLYDAMQYNQQVADTAAKHKEEKSRRDKQKQKISNAEFLSGFHKDDKLIPVITLVLFFNAGSGMARVRCLICWICQIRFLRNMRRTISCILSVRSKLLMMSWRSFIPA